MGSNPTLSAKLHPYRYGAARYFPERERHENPDISSRSGAPWDFRARLEAARLDTLGLLRALQEMPF